MINIEYKILFEVRVLHDYFLFGSEPSSPDEDEKSFFAMSPAAQATRLQELLRRGRYDMRQYLDFLIGTTEQKAFRDLHLKMTKTSTGFFVGMEVNRTAPSGSGVVRFTPTIRPLDDTLLNFGSLPSLRRTL